MLPIDLFDLTTVVHVYSLQFNSFTDNGIISLGKGLKNNANFKALYIYGNTKITSDGISEAVAQMQSNGNKQIALDIPC